VSVSPSSQDRYFQGLLLRRWAFGQFGPWSRVDPEPAAVWPDTSPAWAAEVDAAIGRLGLLIRQTEASRSRQP
jgi:hypothetical protein